MSELAMPLNQDVLDPERHKRLIADMYHVCDVANVSESMVRQSSKPYLNSVELDWVRNFPKYRREGVGLVLTGLQSIAPETKIMAICGALIRNFIDARIVSLHALLKAVETTDAPDPTVMLIPNLFASTTTKALPDWKLQSIYDVLLRRHAKSRPTVLFVEDMAKLEAAYGHLLAQHLTTKYKVSA